MNNKFKRTFWLFICLALFVVFNLRAGLPEKGFEALKIFDYFSAKKYFEKAHKHYPTISSYGLALIYSRNDNPFYNLDSSYSKILESREYYPLQQKREFKTSKKLAIDSLTLVHLFNRIEVLAFEKAVKYLDIDTLNHFISYYTLSTLVPAAIIKRDSLAYRLALNQKSASALKEYISKYPQSKFLNEARPKYEKMFFVEETREGTADAFSRFASNYPQSPYKEQAELKLYKLLTDGKADLTTYFNFIQKYPGNSFTDEAWQKVYSIYRSEKPQNTIPDFLTEFPSFIFKERLMEEYRLEGVDYLPYKQGELWGFINVNGEIVVEAKYDFVETFSEGMAIVSNKGKLGYITKTGEELVPPIYDEAENFHNSLAVVGENGKFGVIDRKGKMQIALSYSEIADFSEGLAVAFDGQFYGYINRTGAVIIPFRFDEAGEFRNGTAVCMINEMYGIIDSAGNEVIPFYYDGIENFYNGFSRVRKNDLVGLINKEGTLILPADFDEIGPFSHNRALVSKDGKIGYINLQGRIVIPLIYKSGPEIVLKSGFDNGYAIVKSSSYFGIIDSSGKRIVPLLFEDIGKISEGVAPIKKSGKWGYVNLNSGKIFIKPTFEKALSFSKDKAIVVKKGSTRVIDKTGRVVIPFENEAIREIENGIFVATRSGKIGIVDGANAELVPFEYDKYVLLKERYLRLSNAAIILWFDNKTKKVFWKG
ncbi:MAG: WG repeat-containing protein [Bacteroidetes bacterium]|nr:WG repeat-containing protein [Bacteroidota bacterium]